MKKFRAVIIVLLCVVVVMLFLYKGKDIFQEQVYPKKYNEYVEKYAKKYDVDENLVYAIIKIESGFDPTAVSNVGAIGLMQMMEPSYDWVKGKMKDTRKNVYNDLFEPELSIEYGTFLIADHLKEFDSIDNALAAYHAGRGSVNSWLKDENLSSGDHIHTIPIEATDLYVKKVNKAYKEYKKINP